MKGTIVCGVTATHEARAATQQAEALAMRLGLRLVLVHVVDADRRATDGAFERDALADSASSAAELRIVHGNRVDALARVAADEGADLIVLGSRTHRPSGRLRCTLAQQLEAAQSVPVLIAPPATRPRSSSRLSLAEAAAGR
jgi:nucleotide-binding universal stress UspA family protein